MAIAVDDVYDAVLVDEQELKPVPGIDVTDGLLVGVVRRGGDLIAVLDAEVLLEALVAAGEREMEGCRT